MKNIDVFEQHTNEYDAWFDRHPFVYQSELAAIKTLSPHRGEGIEIGVGTGRFAVPLGIGTGVEPAANMRTLAEKRGIKVFGARAEALPFGDGVFDYALMVTTICFLDNIPLALREVHRVLKTPGALVIGFIDKESPLGLVYRSKKSTSQFYQDANFYSAKEVTAMVKEAGFADFHYAQTLFGNIQQMDRVDPAKEGFGRGSFVVLRGNKPIN